MVDNSLASSLNLSTSDKNLNNMNMLTFAHHGMQAISIYINYNVISYL
jgi:hypothetical protein